MTPILFDSNILVYAHNLDSPFYEQARGLHQKVISGELEAAVAIQNLLEFYSVITNPSIVEAAKPPDEAKNLCLNYITYFEVIYPKEVALNTTLTLAQHKKVIGRKIFDTFLVATMLANGLDIIYTNNEKHFEIFKEIKAVNPFK